MARRHTFVVAALLALSVAAGSLGLARTLKLGAASAEATNAQVTAQERRLNAFEASLRRQLADSPAVPVGTQVTPSRAQRIEYVRPSPIVVSASASGYESEDDGGVALEHEVGEHDD